MSSRMRGFTMIEVLVALLVLAIGLLGVAGLQSSSLAMNQGSYLRSQATVLANDIADRMRANPRGVGAGAYDMGGSGKAVRDTNCDTAGTGCGSVAMAQNDLYQWNADAANRLPQGQGYVCIDSTPKDGTPGSPKCDGSGAIYTIKVWWFDKESGSGKTERFSTQVRTK